MNPQSCTSLPWAHRHGPQMCCLVATFQELSAELKRRCGWQEKDLDSVSAEVGVELLLPLANLALSLCASPRVHPQVWHNDPLHQTTAAFSRARARRMGASSPPPAV